MEKESEVILYRGEIGSEYWVSSLFDPKRSEYNFPGWLVGGSDRRLLLSGRTALDYIIREIKRTREIRSVYLPAYSCDSMIEPFRNNGLDILFYDVEAREGRLRGKIDTSVKCDIFFSLSYFGFQDKSLPKLQMIFKDHGTIVIEDLTHSLFCCDSLKTEADYSFASLRKWFGLPDGGIAWKHNGTFEKTVINVSDFSRLRKEAMCGKEVYMKGENQGISKESFLKKLKECEERLNKDYAGYGMSEFSQKLLIQENIYFLQERRKENAYFLYQELNKTKKIDWVYQYLMPEDCPLFVPILVKDGLRDKLRKYLIDRKIYCPVHWPVPDKKCLSKTTSYLYHNMLSLVCDQRYSLAHMMRIVEEIKKYCNE